MSLGASNLLELSTDVLEYLLTHVDSAVTLARVRQVCFQLNQIASRDRLWQLWLVKDFGIGAHLPRAVLRETMLRIGRMEEVGIAMLNKGIDQDRDAPIGTDALNIYYACASGVAYPELNKIQLRWNVQKSIASNLGYLGAVVTIFGGLPCLLVIYLGLDRPPETWKIIVGSCLLVGGFLLVLTAIVWMERLRRLVWRKFGIKKTFYQFWRKDLIDRQSADMFQRVVRPLYRA